MFFSLFDNVLLLFTIVFFATIHRLLIKPVLWNDYVHAKNNNLFME